MKWIQIFITTTGLVILLLLLIVSVNRQSLEARNLYRLAQIESLLTKSLEHDENLIAQNVETQGLLTGLTKAVKSGGGKASTAKKSAAKPKAAAKPKEKAKPVDYTKVIGGMLAELKKADGLRAKKEKDKAVAILTGLKKKTWELSTKLPDYKASLAKLMGIFDQVIAAWKGGKEHPAIKSIQGTYDGILGKLNKAKKKK